MKNNDQTRRSFVRQMLLGTAGMSVMSSGHMGMINAAFASSSMATTANDYKALVCIFLYGGNDSSNAIVPISGAPRNTYEQLRQTLAVNNALEINTDIEGGLGFHPQMERLKLLYDQGKVAIQANVGTYYPGRFAHNAHQDTWMRGADRHHSKGHGWGARMLDLLSSDKPNFLQNISLYGNTTFCSGEKSSAFAVGHGHIPQIRLYHSDTEALERKPIIENHLQHSTTADNALIREYANTYLRAERQTEDVRSTLEALPAVTGFNSSDLSQQLRRVVEFIQIGKSRGLSRQIFFVGLDGFDTHRGQESANYHSNKLEQVSESIGEFYDATVQLNIENEVTAFTMSEFGRTLTPNTGGGTDHGWGGHQFIIGGAVNGKVYGRMPTPDELDGKGILEPSTQAEQMTSSLASWYGLSNSQLRDIFPLLETLEPINYFS